MDTAFAEWRAEVDRRLDVLEAHRADERLADLEAAEKDSAAFRAEMRAFFKTWTPLVQQVREIHEAIVPDRLPDPDATPNQRGGQ